MDDGNNGPKYQSDSEDKSLSEFTDELYYDAYTHLQKNEFSKQVKDGTIEQVDDDSGKEFTNLEITFEESQPDEKTFNTLLKKGFMIGKILKTLWGR